MRAGESGDPLLGRLVETSGPVEALAQIRGGSLAANSAGVLARDSGRSPSDLQTRVAAWRARLLAVDPARDLATGYSQGARLVVPGDVEWPTQLDDLGVSRPTGLWVKGAADLRYSCLRSVAVVGARAATPYGVHVATACAAELSEAGWSIVSGGAYGIDAAAHRGALAGEAATIAVLACGTDYCYPSGHHDLFAAVRERGALVSESPPGMYPTRSRFLVRNRLIAALSRGTVVVEAALRSGALNTVNHALALHRHVGVVPGPITSAASAGCHLLLRQGKAQCVTGPTEVIDLIGGIGADLAPEPRAPVVPRDSLSAEARAVLDAVPSRGRGAGPATIAVAAGVDLATALSRLGALAAAGYVQHGPNGWRLRFRS
ncbi:DNA-processing protein DprA [Spongiactinospora sp. TRM90649]|uniref:DNA-processing protein DprA n=1 Tax=Spongiactinospora sp. TRM90649 TaxID=3031114 RepID=UPI0023F82828|nr:DNA-processing protein DprA [Spongiactinospora sp. TRM90649]MDF5752711.1 DNA-processing protein DprA [Spongiactinospora sp. TRM90649]